MMAISSVSSSSCFTGSAAIQHPPLLSHKNFIHKSSFSLNRKRLGAVLQNNFNFCEKKMDDARCMGRKTGVGKSLTGSFLVTGKSVKASQKRNLEAVGVPTSVPVRVAHELLQAGHKCLDVRTPEEFSAGHAPGAVNIPCTKDVKEPRIAKRGVITFQKT